MDLQWALSRMKSKIRFNFRWRDMNNASFYSHCSRSSARLWAIRNPTGRTGSFRRSIWNEIN